MKARIAVDCTASGLNRASLSMPFRYPGLQDGLAIVERGCWLAKLDVSRYFFAFSIATAYQCLFMLNFLGVLYYLARCCFGYSVCPYYCSAWSAEFRSWMLSQGIPCAHMMDDWLTRGKTESEAVTNQNKISGVLTKSGFVMAPEKAEVGQLMVFLGVLINTITMMLSFDRTQSKGMKVELESFLRIIEKGGNLDTTTTRHIAGKLGWYSEVLQSGRLHIRSWWLYLKYGAELRLPMRLQLIRDTKWWIDILAVWSAGEVSGIEYPILSASELLGKHMIYVVQSDVSGVDGFGYFHGFIDDEDPPFVSQAWNETFFYDTSHNSELKALLHFLEGATVRKVVLLWVTDCLAAAWSLNKGRCREDIGLVTLAKILELCDTKMIQIVALWVPRESNLLADYLSHLSFYMNRNVDGRLSDLPLHEGLRGGDISHKEQQGGSLSAAKVQDALPSEAHSAISGNLSFDRSISVPACSQQSGVNRVVEQPKVVLEDTVRVGEPPVVNSTGCL
jgi:hypothetical protein